MITINNIILYNLLDLIKQCYRIIVKLVKDGSKCNLNKIHICQSIFSKGFHSSDLLLPMIQELLTAN